MFFNKNEKHVSGQCIRFRWIRYQWTESIRLQSVKIRIWFDFRICISYLIPWMDRISKQEETKHLNTNKTTTYAHHCMFVSFLMFTIDTKWAIDVYAGSYFWCYIFMFLAQINKKGKKKSLRRTFRSRKLQQLHSCSIFNKVKNWQRMGRKISGWTSTQSIAI